MKNNTLKASLIVLVIILAGVSIFFIDKYQVSGIQVSAQIENNSNPNPNNTFVLYEFYGEGCPHCAQLNSVLEEHAGNYPLLKINRYEIYHNQNNQRLFEYLAESYGANVQGVPTVFINDKVIVGFNDNIKESITEEIEYCQSNSCEDPINRLGENMTEIIANGTVINPVRPESLTNFKIISLAVVDAVNPCALAVLALMLIAILTYNPKNKKKVLLAGLAFTLSVFIMYFIYGLIIIKFFQLVQAISSVRLFLYKALAVVAILLGLLNIKDYFMYKPGSAGTEMPLMMRPKVKKLISGVTSPKGAFFVGIFVTLFLLPCTIGPYLIAGGILSAMNLVQTIPPLLLYNLIFILPMVFITLLVYFGISKVDDVSGWKDRNIKKLHLFAGAIMLILGIAMLLGWV